MLKAVTTDPILDDISLDTPWALVETFSAMPRWKPADVNASADVIASVLKKHGVPVTLHEPTLYLSIPFAASVRAGDKLMKAKPPAYSRDCREWLEAELVYVPAAYSRTIGTLFNKNQDPALSATYYSHGVYDCEKVIYAVQCCTAVYLSFPAESNLRHPSIKRKHKRNSDARRPPRPACRRRQRRLRSAA